MPTYPYKKHSIDLFTFDGYVKFYAGPTERKVLAEKRNTSEGYIVPAAQVARLEFANAISGKKELQGHSIPSDN